MKLKQGDEIRVTWTDAASVSGGWKAVRELRTWKVPEIVSLGYFAFYSIDGIFYYKSRDMNDDELGTDGEVMLCPSFVPRGCIKKVEVIRRAR